MRQVVGKSKGVKGRGVLTKRATGKQNRINGKDMEKGGQRTNRKPKHQTPIL